jgi:hypothetical protein
MSASGLTGKQRAPRGYTWDKCPSCGDPFVEVHHTGGSRELQS